jgi:CDP-diacylglycerol---glycerol-3-phosphate 3-phosphatidyltransferase
MIGDGATDWTATEGAEPMKRRVNPPSTMDWLRFMRAWAEAYDGFDLRYAGPFSRWWAWTAYKWGLRLARMGVSAAILTVVTLVAAMFVPLMAVGRGRWALGAAVFVGVSVFAGAAGRAVSVLLGQAVRREAFYRSLAERASEVCWLLAAALLGAASILVVICMVLLAVHEYVRARATVSGMRPAGTATIGDRPLRIIATLVFLGIAGLVGSTYTGLAAGTSTLVLALWALLALFGLVQLLSIVHKALPS